MKILNTPLIPNSLARTSWRAILIRITKKYEKTNNTFRACP